MRHIIFADAANHKVALLMKPSAFKKNDLIQHYIEPWKKMGLQTSDVIGFTLEQDGKKVTDKYAKEYLNDLLPILKEQGCQYLYVADATYFKILSKQKKADPNLGYVLPCALSGYEDLHVVLGFNYQQLIYDPSLVTKMDQTLYALASHVNGNYIAPGTGIIKKAVYFERDDIPGIKSALNELMKYPELTIDIEAFSLKFWDAGIGSIAIAIDEHHGIAFPCDYKPYSEPTVIEEIVDDKPVKKTHYGCFEKNTAVRALVKDFLINYRGKLTWHNAAYDVKVVVYSLWMQTMLDQRGLLEGLDIMASKMDDTKVIAYLATNSTAGNVLGLKPLAQEFAGNWSKDDIKDIRLIPLPELLQYNLVDSLSTWWVKKKYYPIMVADQQEDLYKGLFLDSLKLIIQIELTGMPMSLSKIAEVRSQLESIRDTQLKVINGNPTIRAMNALVQEKAWNKDFEDRQKKAKNPQNIKPKDQAAFANLEFNPNSGPQLQVLLYDLMGLPVIDYTDTKQPATGAETLEKLINHTAEPSYKAIIKALVEYGQVIKILSTFIPAFEGSIVKDPNEPDLVWLHGSFNLGGTVSGRLSSSDPKQIWGL